MIFTPRTAEGIIITIEIRLAECSDAPELKKLNDLFNGENNNTVDAIEKSLFKNDAEIVCVAACGDELAGFCCGQFQASMCYSYEYAVITEFFIREKYRRQGVGRRLLKFTEAEFIKRGVKHFHLSTGGDNAAALALYRSSGYDVTSVMLEKDAE